MQIVRFAENFHLFHETEHMGRDAVHIERDPQHNGPRIPDLIKNAGMICRGSQLFAYFFASDKHPLQEEKIS